MATMKLTKRSVDALTPDEAGDFFAWDTTLKGFGVRVWPTGRKAFMLKYRPAGQRRTKRVTIGAYGVLAVEEARDHARRYLGEIVDGADPALTRARARRAPTVAELGAEYLADVVLHRKPGTAREYARLWRKHVSPAMGTTTAATVTAADVKRLHHRLRETPYLANRVLALLGSFFAFAEREAVRPQHDNPAHGIEAFPERARERFLTHDEFQRLGEALERAEREGLRPAPEDRKRPKSKATEKHRPKKWDVPKPAAPQAVAALRLLALTGCREGEILSLRWDAVDLERGFLRLADTKTGKSVRPLGAPALAFLAELPRDPASPYVFPGTDPSRHFASLAHTWRAVRHAARLDGVRLHDLRHSFASVSALGGDSLLLTRDLLGHKNIATTQRYAHLGDSPVKTAADRAAGSISAWMDRRETPVTPLRNVQAG